MGDEVFIVKSFDVIAKIVDIFAEVEELHFFFFSFFLFDGVEFINDAVSLVSLTAIVALVIFFLFHAVVDTDNCLFATVGAMNTLC